MNRLVMILAVAVIASLVLALPRAEVNAARRDMTARMSLAQAAEACDDKKLVDGVIKDINAGIEAFKKVPTTGAGGVYSILFDIGETRIKYEDMKVTTGACEQLIIGTIIYFANMGDYGLNEMAGKFGLDSATIKTNRDIIAARVDKLADNLKPLLGTDTK